MSSLDLEANRQATETEKETKTTIGTGTDTETEIAIEIEITAPFDTLISGVAQQLIAGREKPLVQGG